MEGVVGFVEEQGHALLGAHHVGAEAEAGSGLLLLEGVEAFGDGVGADAEFFAVVGEALDFIGGRVCGWRRDGGGSAGGLLRYCCLRGGAGGGFGCVRGFAAADFYGCIATGDGGCAVFGGAD